MSTYIKAFLETEITGIPQIMDRYIGKYYNNALYNGITWLILILHIIHFVFDLFVNTLLRKMRFKEYVRIRLKKSLWYLGFYGCSFLYSSATIYKNNIKLPHRYKFNVLDLTEPVSGHLLLGYALLSAFYASSSMWEGLQCSISSFTYLFLTGFVAFTYFLRYIELAILLASTFSIIHVMLELTRCLFCVIKPELGLSRLLVKIAFVMSLTTFIITYFLIIPVSFLLPLARGLLKNSNSIIMTGLNLSLWGWLICEICSSPLCRLIQHRWYHTEKGSKVPDCVGSVIECALFLPRDDVAYNLKIIKQEIKERQAKMMALRKPKKGANMLVQTLKCVAAINRKIKYRKLLEQSLPSTSDIKTDELSDTKLEEEIQQSSISFVDESPTMMDKKRDEYEKLEEEDEEIAAALEDDTFDKDMEETERTTDNKNVNVANIKEDELVSLWCKKDVKVQFIGIVEEDKEEEIEREYDETSSNLKGIEM